MKHPARSLLLAMIFLGVASADAQTANSSPTAPAPGGLPGTGTPPPTTRIPPSGGKTGTAVSAAGQPKAYKPSAAEIRAQKQLDRDMNICKGC